MSEQEIKNLNDPDKSKRRDAIFALARSGDPRAMGPLSKAAQTEVDPNLKELAEKAARHIQKIAWEHAAADHAASQTLPGSQLSVIPQPATSVQPAPQVSITSQINQKKKILAKGYVDRAMGFKVARNDKQAIESLIEAMRIWPDITNETMTRNLAASLLNATPAEAIESLQQEAGRLEEEAAKRPKVGLQTIRESPDVQKLVLEMAVLAIVAVIVWLGAFNTIRYLGNIGQIELQRSIEAQGKANLQFHASADELYQTAYTDYMSFPINQRLGNILVLGLTFMFATLIDSVLIYMIGIMFGGIAEPVGFLRAFMRVEIAVYGIYSVGALGISYAVSQYFASPTLHPLAGNTLLLVGINLGLITLAYGGEQIALYIVIKRRHNLTWFKTLACAFIGGGIFLALVSIFGIFR